MINSNGILVGYTLGLFDFKFYYEKREKNQYARNNDHVHNRMADHLFLYKLRTNHRRETLDWDRVGIGIGTGDRLLCRDSINCMEKYHGHLDERFDSRWCPDSLCSRILFSGTDSIIHEL